MQAPNGPFPRRIILSRKGFDQENGGCASPICDATGAMCSLPIPDRKTNLRYRDINLGSPMAGLANLGRIVESLPKSHVTGSSEVHLDPDLRAGLHPEHGDDWRGLFGQSSAALSHLKDQGVAQGDLFLYFGWFRRVRASGSSGIEYLRTADDEHVIWGWLQVQSTISPSGTVPMWASHHPHVVVSHGELFVGSDRLSFAPSMEGAGTFDHYDPRLRLTCPGVRRNRTLWRIPWFFARENPRLTYHPKTVWQQDGDYAIGKSADKGQEFVLSTEGIEEEVGRWLSQLFAIVHPVTERAKAARS